MVVKKKYFVFIVFILLIFSLLTYQGVKKESNLIPHLSLYPLMIIEQGISYGARKIQKIVHSYILIVGKEDENRRLAEQIKEFEEEKNRYREATLENERLRKLLELKSKRPDYVTSAEVYARDPTNWFQSLWINKGENDGITKNMIAVTPLGVVGRIQRVLSDRADVLTIANINSFLAVRIQSSRIEGILEGRSGNKCSLLYVPKDVPVEKGEKVVTSGLDGIYPKGLAVGYISKVENRPGEPFSFIEVSLIQNLNSVEEVMILKR